ncbi:hypothetical protein Agau_P100045 (plasmid) [Agrobacterium tumefaciens F2]|nr:hypothetical protein Agau_P100045 [Agrobacterium tumefaciens F2]
MIWYEIDRVKGRVGLHTTSFESESSKRGASPRNQRGWAALAEATGLALKRR